MCLDSVVIFPTNHKIEDISSDFYLTKSIYQTSLRNTSSGELFKTLLILLNPIPSTKSEIPGKKTKNGITEGY